MWSYILWLFFLSVTSFYFMSWEHSRAKFAFQGAMRKRAAGLKNKAAKSSTQREQEASAGGNGDSNDWSQVGITPWDKTKQIEAESCLPHSVPLLPESAKQIRLARFFNDISINPKDSHGPSIKICLPPSGTSEKKNMTKRRLSDCEGLVFLWRLLMGGETLTPTGLDYVLQHLGVGSLDALKGGKALVGKKSGPSPPMFVDVGGGVGTCAALIAMLGGEAVAFEADPLRVHNFVGTMSLNPQLHDKIQLWPIVIGDENLDDVILSHGDSDAVHGGLKFADSLVKIRRLDDVLWSNQAVPPPTIALLNVDAEGREAHVLRGARRLLESGAIKIIQLNFAPTLLRNSGSSTKDVCSFLFSRGYTLKLATKVRWLRSPQLSMALCNRLAKVRKPFIQEKIIAIHRSLK